jgi:hypothetical protein
MDLSSLPNYPTVYPPKSHACVEKGNQVFPPRGVHRLWDFTFLVAIVLLLCCLKWLATEIKRPPDPPPQPLDFQIVKQRYS